MNMGKARATATMVVTMTAACGSTKLPSASPAMTAESKLDVAASTEDMIWNAVAVDRGHVYVSAPRWTGSRGPQLAVLDQDNRPRAYPDAGWNGWKPGSDPSQAFVNINAIHLDGAGGLWIVDTGSPDFGGDPIPRGAKLVRVALDSGVVDRVIAFGPAIAKKGSYIDDVRFHEGHAYLTDAGAPGLIVVDLATGSARRVLDDHASVRAPADRDIVLGGAVVKAPSGQPLRVHADPLELSPDGQWLYYASLEGPWSRVATRWLDDPALSPAELTRRVEPWADLPPVGGTAMSPKGDLYFTDLRTNALRKRAPDGTITTLVVDPRLHWVDAPFLDHDGSLWLPVPQMDRVALFNGGTSRIERPIMLFRFRTGASSAIE